MDTHEQTTLTGEPVTVVNDPLPIGQSTPYLGRAEASQLGLELETVDPTSLFGLTED